MTWTPEKRGQYYATAKAKRDAAALAAGREPGRVGQPPKYTEEEKREIRRIKSAKWREENQERAREITRESMKRAAAAKALAEGREPGKVGRPSSKTAEEKRANRARLTREHYQRHPEVLEKAKAREIAKRRGNFVSQALPRLTKDEKKLIERVNGANRRARVRNNGGKHTKDDIIRLMIEQEGKCAFCGLPFGDDGYHVDHFIPISRGGSNNPSNLKLLHPTCNLKKGAHDPIEFGFTIGEKAEQGDV